VKGVTEVRLHGTDWAQPGAYTRIAPSGPEILLNPFRLFFYKTGSASTEIPQFLEQIHALFSMAV